MLFLIFVLNSRTESHTDPRSSYRVPGRAAIFFGRFVRRTDSEDTYQQLDYEKALEIARRSLRSQTRDEARQLSAVLKIEEFRESPWNCEFAKFSSVVRNLPMSKNIAFYLGSASYRRGTMVRSFRC
jgi:hypothetical protein